MPTQVIKVSTVLAALDWQVGPALVIQAPHLAHAIAICEKWRASAHRVLKMATEDEESALLERLVRQLGKAGQQGITLRDLYKLMKGKTPRQIEGALEQLIKAGAVEEFEQPTGPKGGKPTLKYRLV